MKFVDLFSGLGGFHVALSSLGHECVFAAEIDPVLRELYEKNFGIRPASDVRFCWKDVPPHDILCAGFPCQPFSKAGSQRGFLCPDSGDLFDYILKVVDIHKPTYLLFENVPNILRHAAGATWTRIQESLRERGYDVDCTEISPHQVGVPQIRNRAIIVAQRGSLKGFSWPKLNADLTNLHVSTVLDPDIQSAEKLSTQYLSYLNAWEGFLERTKEIENLPSFPIWAMEFGADYPLTGTPPSKLTQTDLSEYNGAFGIPLRGLRKIDQIKNLPPYVAKAIEKLPSWKVRFIEQNRAFYSEHHSILSDWLPTIQSFPPSFQKFEWNWKDGKRTIWDKVVQFRASGIRVKNPVTSPSLVALTTSQVPVIAWQSRYMTVRECARLQSLDVLPQLPNSKTQAFKALGNAVNATVIRLVAEKLLKLAETAPSRDESGQYIRQFAN